MTNSPEGSAPLSPSVKLPGVAILLFIAGPVLVVVGLFLASGNAFLRDDRGADLTQLGTVLFWIGVAGIIIAVVLEGVRSIAEQQVHILLRSRE
jgi:hypothetical protein